MPEGSPLVSTTDLKRHLTYSNPAFIEVGGYECEELLGRLHNMVRQPPAPTGASGAHPSAP